MAFSSLIAFPTALARSVLILKCSYEHHNMNEPAIVLGGAFVVDAV